MIYENSMELQALFNLVYRELGKARAKFPQQSIWITLAALTEEIGELNQAILQATQEPSKGRDIGDIQKEAVQCIVMVCRVLFDCDLPLPGAK